MVGHRDRSRSPGSERKSKKTSGGFKWKDEKKASKDPSTTTRKQYRERDYKNTAEPLRSYDQSSRTTAANEPTPDVSGTDLDLDEQIIQKFGRKAAIKLAEQERAMVKANKSEDRVSRLQPTTSSSQDIKQAPRASEKYITIWVNDRLGTKVAVPSLPSDKIGDFKIIVAHSTGRPPGQFIIKRQGERPFKDHLTLADYEISDGVQLDLEVAS